MSRLDVPARPTGDAASFVERGTSSGWVTV
jgi:hypothetical protein